MRHLTILLAAAGLVAGCKTSYAFHYEPHPLEIHVQTMEVAPPIARVMISALGGERFEGANGVERLEERFLIRIENRTLVPIALDASELELVDGDLRSFGAARTEPSPPPLVAPGEEGVVEVFVAFPEGIDPDDLNLWQLNLRWGLAVEELRHLFGSNFRRVEPGRGPYGYYGPQGGTRVGVFISGTVTN